MLDATQNQPRQRATLLERARLSLTGSDVLVAVLLIFTLLLGGYFRFMSTNWDDFVRFHPDERFLSQVAERLGSSPIVTSQRTAEMQAECVARYGDGIGGYFDTQCSPFNPENVYPTQYVYGTLPLFMARAAGEFLVDQTGDPSWIQYNGIHLVWRTLSAMADTIVIWLVFLIGLRMHNKWVGLVAAMLYAGAVLPIQQAHFGTADAITNLFVTLAIFFAVRAQDTGKLWDYAIFGIAFGAAVASRVNVAPLAAVIIIVAFVRALPAFDLRTPEYERNRLLLLNFIGLVLAGTLSILMFRLTNPYAFAGPSIFGIFPDSRYIDTLSQAQFSVSGEMDWAPNWQWVGRIPYLFAFQNMVLWGMGIAFGAAGWLAWIWSGIRLFSSREQAIRNIVPFSWVLIYFLFAGGLWVMSMRYYLPLYPVLAVLAAWGLVELVKRSSQASVAMWRRVLARATLIGVVGLTLLWGLMFTNIYRQMATFTQASHWVWENVPGDFSMQIDGASEDTPLINIPIINGFVPDGTPDDKVFFSQGSRLSPGTPTNVSFIAPADGTVSTVRANRLVGIVSRMDATTNQMVWDYDNGNVRRTLEVSVRDVNGQVLATASITDTFDRGDHFLGQPYELTFDQPFQVTTGQSYTLSTLVTGDAPLMVSGSVMLNEPWDEPMPATICQLPAGVTLADNPPSGLRDASNCNGRNVWLGLLNGTTLNLHYEDGNPDGAIKRAQMQTWLDQTDYIIIGTNRRYDSQSRNPNRWPMTNAYYDALFNGELGFDLVATFQETFELGPIQISDQHLPTYSSPQWLNEFEAEEAFHVYDHPVVFIFEKNDTYSSVNTAAILASEPLNRVSQSTFAFVDPTLVNVMTLPSLEIDPSPTQLLMTDEMRELQQSGGTWSERFDINNAINQPNTVSIGSLTVHTNEVLGVVIWWIGVTAFGLAMWPLLFMAFPALADRGYAFARFTGMLLVAWIAWILATARIPMWNQGGIFAILIAVSAVSTLIVWRNRDTFTKYLRLRWRLLLFIEIAGFALFLMLVFVRLSNPDLWHSSFGGEKPMDFAYFNAVLRSTTFPAIDPWFAGGYLNYYYFGFVIVGTPTLLLGVMPSLAYNLIIPTIFSATGIAAFSVTFSIVNGWRSRDANPEHIASRARRPIGNPWVAGIAALMLAVILGNLDTARVFANGVAQTGGYQPAVTYETYLINKYREEFIAANGVLPDETQSAQILVQVGQEARNAGFFDQLEYRFDYVTSFFAGIGNMLSGQPLRISPERWFWGPTRIITEDAANNGAGDGAIAEMPFFTFLYGDLHAHMISMPMQLFVLAFLYAELLVAGRDRRVWWARIIALALGSGTVGLFQATNTWEFPTFTILGALGLGYAWWLNWGKISRWSLLSMVVRVGGFFVIGALAALPFTHWFASGITDFKIWEGRKTALWVYLTIHGTFLFLFVSLLTWETARWLRSIKVSALRGKLTLLYVIFGSAVLVLVASLIMLVAGYNVALIVLPLVAWLTLLFFRPGQSRSMQFVLVLAGLALAITLGTEIVTLANDNGRQNTIFKFYLQAWLMLSVVGGAALAWITRSIDQWRLRLFLPWFIVAALLFFVAVLYPIQATNGKAQFRLAPTPPSNTLDGMAYMQYARHTEAVDADRVETFDLVHDYNAIRWLQENVEGSPVIMEAQSYGSLYKWGGRISIYTGLPSVIGWDFHQRQQRSIELLPSLVNQRAANVNAFYSTTDIGAAADILRFYDVRYVIVTNYERARYEVTGGLSKFNAMLEADMLSIAYQQGEATIYEVNQDVLNAVLIASLDIPQ